MFNVLTPLDFARFLEYCSRQGNAMNAPLRPNVRYRRHDAVTINTQQVDSRASRRSILTLWSKTSTRNPQDKAKERNWDWAARHT